MTSTTTGASGWSWGGAWGDEALDEQEDEDERSVSSHVELCCGMGPPTVKLVTHVANNSQGDC